MEFADDAVGDALGFPAELQPIFNQLVFECKIHAALYSSSFVGLARSFHAWRRYPGREQHGREQHGLEQRDAATPSSKQQLSASSASRELSAFRMAREQLHREAAVAAPSAAAPAAAPAAAAAAAQSPTKGSGLSIEAVEHFEMSQEASRMRIEMEDSQRRCSAWQAAARHLLATLEPDSAARRGRAQPPPSEASADASAASVANRGVEAIIGWASEHAAGKELLAAERERSSAARSEAALADSRAAKIGTRLRQVESRLAAQEEMSQLRETAAATTATAQLQKKLDAATKKAKDAADEAAATAAELDRLQGRLQETEEKLSREIARAAASERQIAEANAATQQAQAEAASAVAAANLASAETATATAAAKEARDAESSARALLLQAEERTSRLEAELENLAARERERERTGRHTEEQMAEELGKLSGELQLAKKNEAAARESEAAAKKSEAAARESASSARAEAARAALRAETAAKDFQVSADEAAAAKSAAVTAQPPPTPPATPLAAPQSNASPTATITTQSAAGCMSAEPEVPPLPPESRSASLAASASNLDFATLETAAAWAGALADQILLRAKAGSLLQDGLPSDAVGITCHGASAMDGTSRAPSTAASALADTIRENVEAMRAAVGVAITQATREQHVLTEQLTQRGELVAQREVELAMLEVRQREAATKQALSRLAVARTLVARRAVDSSQRALLGRCWRALCLNASASRLLADRKRFRLLAQHHAQVHALQSAHSSNQAASGASTFHHELQLDTVQSAVPRASALGRVLRAVD